MCKKRNKTAALVLISVLFSILATVAAYCIHKYLSDDRDLYDDDEDEEYIDENGVCYTDEKNFVD